jgi:hypothetical protein
MHNIAQYRSSLVPRMALSHPRLNIVWEMLQSLLPGSGVYMMNNDKEQWRISWVIHLEGWEDNMLLELPCSMVRNSHFWPSSRQRSAQEITYSPTTQQAWSRRCGTGYRSY